MLNKIESKIRRMERKALSLQMEMEYIESNDNFDFNEYERYAFEFSSNALYRRYSLLTSEYDNVTGVLSMLINRRSNL